MEYPLFEVGDIIRVDDYDALKARSEFQYDDGSLAGFKAGFVSDMRCYCGTLQEVSAVFDLGEGKRCYRLKGTRLWNWSADMFDLSFHQEPELDFEITEEDLLKIL